MQQPAVLAETNGFGNADAELVSGSVFSPTPLE